MKKDFANELREEILKNLKPEDIDLVVCTTVTPDAPVPSTAAIICDKCDIRDAIAFDMNGGVITKAASEAKVLDPIIALPFSYSFSVPAAGIFDSRIEQGYVNTGWNTSKYGNVNNGSSAPFSST